MENLRADTGKSGLCRCLRGVLRRNGEFAKPFGTRAYRENKKARDYGPEILKWSSKADTNLRPFGFEATEAFQVGHARLIPVKNLKFFKLFPKNRH
ncbi:MAG: hypothetical protein A2017_07660 [Lentisphaerae bacterium GWF2_44_16]|nr:MAG: hypothetical protein A2017_07660 [Lentisphaerae bacterium GWF2_44_16]